MSECVCVCVCEYIVVVTTFMELSISGDRSVAMRVEPAMGLLLGGPAVLDIVSAGTCGSVSLTHYYALVVHIIVLHCCCCCCVAFHVMYS